MALALSFLPILLGIFLHASTTSKLIPASWISNTFLARGILWPFVVVMVLVAVSNRVSAWLDRHTAPEQSAAVFLRQRGRGDRGGRRAAPDPRARGLDVQSPWLMALPITYLVAGRLWRGHSPERPLTWVAQAATVVILIGVLAASIKVGGIETALSPRTGEPANLLYGLVFVEVAAFYVLASIISAAPASTSRSPPRPPAAPSGSCSGTSRSRSRITRWSMRCSGWQSWPFPGFWGSSRWSSTDTRNPNTSAIRGKGLRAFQMGNAIVSVALLAAFLQGLMRWAVSQGGFSLVVALAMAILAADHGRRAGARRGLAAMVHHRGHRHGRRDVPHARRAHRT